MGQSEKIEIMECLVNLLCTLLIASISIKSNVPQTSLRTTDFQNSYWEQTPPPHSFNPYDPKVNIRRTHTMGSYEVERPNRIITKQTTTEILTIVIIVIFAIGILGLCDIAFLEEDSKKAAFTEPEKKWISCDSVKSTNTNNSRIIQDMHKIASPINVLGKQMGNLEKVTTFISTLIEEGIKNFSFEDLSKAQQLEIFLFDTCMAKNLLLAKEKIPNVYVPEIDKTINSAYRNLKDKQGTKMDEFLDTKTLIEIRTPFYLNDLQGLIENSTEMYMPYSLYFFICEAPLESILNKEKVTEEIKRIRSDTRILEKIFLFMKAFEPHYNWLLGRINSF